MNFELRARIRRRPLALLLVILLTTGGFGAWHYLRESMMTGRAYAIVVAPGPQDLTQQNAAIFTAKSQAKAYVLLGQDSEVLDEVAQTLGIEGGAAAVADSVVVTQPVDTATIAVEAEASTPETAQELAVALLGVMAERVDELQSGTPQRSRLYLEIISPPSATSAGPSLLVDLLTGFVIGLLVAIVLAWSSGLGDHRAHSRKGSA